MLNVQLNELVNKLDKQLQGMPVDKDTNTVTYS